MPIRRALVTLPVLALALVPVACATERLPPPNEAMPPEDEWSQIAPSKEWLFATADFNGSHKAECDHVLAWVRGEAICRASFCEHGRDLADEWVTRCTPLVPPGLVSEVRALEGQFGGRMTEKPTDCAKKLNNIVRDGCGEDKSCLTTGQIWATHCAQSEGTPLVMRMLQRTIERRSDEGSEPVVLDPRTCSELRADLMIEASKCKDRFVCAEAIPRVLAYRERCESASERPSLGTAVAELTLLAFGTKPPKPIRLAGTAVHPGEVPVLLDDKTGGVISVCDDRAIDLGRYMASRKGCQGGRILLARAFPTAEGPEMRVGAFDFPNDAVFLARYPTIVALGELDLRDQEVAAGLDADLSRAVDLVRSSPADAVRLVVKAVVGSILSIKRSSLVRDVLLKHDPALVPVVRELARAKLAAARSKAAPADLAGLLNRGRTRIFADVALDGSVQIRASTRGFAFETTGVLPQATDAYAAMLTNARARKVDPKTVQAEQARGMAAALACGAALRKLSDSKKALVSCNFAAESCDKATQPSLAKAVDEARLAAEAAFHELETVRTGGAAEASDDLLRAMESAGCREPWW